MNETFVGEIEVASLGKPLHQQNMDAEDDNLVLWVGNLDSRATENMVYELFCQAGPILCIRLPKNPDGQGHKGYCFVTFQHEASVPYAINVMEGTILFGKKLKLQPRPGSSHRKNMDQKKAEQRPEIFQQQSPQLQQSQQPQQQQWFAAHPQMAQVPPNMFVYQNQLYQSFSPTPNMNMNVMAIPFQPAQMGTSYVQIPVQQTHQASPMPHQHQPRGPSNYGGPRTPVMQNGYTPHQYMGGIAQQQLRAASPQQQPGNPSHYNGQQGMNGQPYHSNRPHYQNHSTRGPRPQRNGYANGSIANNNSRMPYHNQQRMAPPGQQPHQQFLVNSAYQGQTVQLVQSPDYRRGNPPQPQQGLPHTVPGPNYGNPGPNGFHNVHVYHY